MDLKELERICQEVLRLEYRQFRRNLKHSEFIDSNYTAHMELNRMMLNVRQKVEQRFKMDPNAKNYIQAQIMLTDYIRMGREYGLRYGKGLGIMKD